MPAVPVHILMPVGEDKASQLRHEKILKAEMKKVNPNKQTVRELMRRSFFLRRVNIVEGQLSSVQDILEFYPALKFPEEVRNHEYLCRLFTSTAYRSFENFVECWKRKSMWRKKFWNQLVPKVLHMSNNSDCQHLIEFISTYSYDEVSDSKYILRCVSAHMLSAWDNVVVVRQVLKHVLRWQVV